MECDGFGLKSVELNLGELAFPDFAPAVHARLSFLGFAAVQPAEELAGVFARGGLAVGRTCEGLYGVAAQ